MQATQTKVIARYLLYTVAVVSVLSIVVTYAAPEKSLSVLESLPARAIVFLFSLSFLTAAAAFIWNIVFIRSTISLLQKTLRAMTFITTLAGAGALFGLPTVNAQMAAELHTVDVDLYFAPAETTSVSLKVFSVGAFSMIVLVFLRFVMARDVRDKGPIDVGLD